MKIMSLVSGITAAFRALFVPVLETANVAVTYPNSEAERYLRLYSMNRSAPYFNEADDNSGDGLMF